jgi:hypothetical protein
MPKRQDTPFRSADETSAIGPSWQRLSGYPGAPASDVVVAVYRVVAGRESGGRARGIWRHRQEDRLKATA